MRSCSSCSTTRCLSWSRMSTLARASTGSSLTLALISSQRLTSLRRSVQCLRMHCPMWGRGAPLPPCPFTSSFPPFYFSLSFIGFTYFLLLSIPSLSTRIVPLRFQAEGRRRRLNLDLVCVLLCNLCYLYSLVKMDCGVLLYLV